MKLIGLEETNLDACVNEAQRERIVITRNGKPVALVVGIQGLDAEEVELGGSPEFWELLTGRRRHRTITRAQLEKEIRLSEKSKPTTEHAVSPHTSGRKKASRRRG